VDGSWFVYTYIEGIDYTHISDGMGAEDIYISSIFIGSFNYVLKIRCHYILLSILDLKRIGTWFMLK